MSDITNPIQPFRLNAEQKAQLITARENLNNSTAMIEALKAMGIDASKMQEQQAFNLNAINVLLDKFG